MPKDWHKAFLKTVPLGPVRATPSRLSESNQFGCQHTILYADESAAYILLLMHAVIQTRTPFQTQPLLSAERTLAYLRREAPFLDQTLYAFPDVIVCEELLCRGQGTSFIESIRSIPACKTLPIIVLSNSAPEARLASAYAAGASHFLIRPQKNRLNKFVLTLYSCISSTPANFQSLTLLEEYRSSPEPRQAA